MCQIPHGYRDRAVLLCKSNYVRFSFVGDRRRAKFTKGTWTHQTNCSLEFWMLLPAQKNCEDQLRKKNMRSSRTSCKVHWGWPWNFRNFILTLKHQMKKIKLTPSNFSFSINTHNASVFVYSNSSVSVSNQNYTHVHKNFFSSQWPVLSHPKILSFPPESPTLYTQTGPKQL